MHGIFSGTAGGKGAPAPSPQAAVSDILQPMLHPSTVNPLRQGLRLCLALLLMLAALLIVAFVFPLLRWSARRSAIRLWSRLFCRAMGVHVHVRGSAPPVGAALIVANHVSWIDIFVIDCWHACRFVAKSEINHWPLIGWLCRHTGTLFIARQRRHDTGRVRQQMVHGLAREHALAVFPEGTTSDGSGLLPFNPSLLQAALDTGAPIYCVSLSYRNAAGTHDSAAAYIDEMSLVQSLHRISAARGLQVVVEVGRPIVQWPGDRRDLAAACRAALAGQMGLPAPEASMTGAGLE